jgi:hypothetical protein
VHVFAQKIDPKNKSNEADKNKNRLCVYMTHLRQDLVTKIPINFVSSSDSPPLLPFIVLDAVDDEKESRKLFKPIVPSLIGSSQQQSSFLQNEQQTHAASTSTIKQQNSSRSTNKNSVLLSAKKEINNEPKTPESQLSYKPMTPNAPPLPPSLKALERSKPIS